MSMHKTPLTEIERTGLEKHRLPVGAPSQLSDCFRLGVKHGLEANTQAVPDGPTEKMIDEGLNAYYGISPYSPSVWSTDGARVRYALKAALAASPQPVVLPVQEEPVAQWQKMHSLRTDGRWENTNEHDAKWWALNSLGWKIRALYTHPAPQPERVPLTPLAQAMQMYEQYPTYRGTRALSWLEAPQEVRDEWMQKAAHGITKKGD